MKRCALDIGGTFTDVLIYDDETREIVAVKTSSEAREPVKSVERAVLEKKLDVSEWGNLIHGSTLASNAIIEKNGCKVGIIATKGHTDTLIHQRQAFRGLPTYRSRKVESLISRDLVKGVRGRINYKGVEVEPLFKEDVQEAAEELVKQQNVNIVLVNFINSYVNNTHELRAAHIVKEMFPNMKVIIASEISAEILEYERGSTAYLSAYLTPLTEGYIKSLSEFFQGQGASKDFRFYMMEAGGGMMDALLATEKAIYTLASGPAAGVLGCQFIGQLIGMRNMISFDMGGTTAKVSCIPDGEITFIPDFTYEGYPVKIAAIDLVEIGAGGGTIAWVDEIGNLHVGPRSAGANPGPACYGKGGKEPTITDAHAVLGRLDPELFTEAEVRIDPKLAYEAVKKVADFYKIEVAEMARGIIEIADNNMRNAISLVSIERGYDPHDFVMVAFGGAGPMHAGRLAKELGIPRVIIPPYPGVHSALGMLAADIKHDLVTNILSPLREIPIDELNKNFEKSEGEATRMLGYEKVKPEEMAFERYLDMRYLGEQYSTLAIPISTKITEELLPDIEKSFHEKHQAFYKFAAPTALIEIVNVRLVAKGRMPEILLKAPIPEGEPKVYRTKVYFDEFKGAMDCPVYKKAELPPNYDIDGPAIVYYYDATAIIYPKQTAITDVYGNLIINS